MQVVDCAGDLIRHLISGGWNPHASLLPLENAKDILNRIEVWRVWGKVHVLDTFPFHIVNNAPRTVDRSVVHDKGDFPVAHLGGTDGQAQ